MSVDDLESHIEDILDVLSEDSEKKVSREELEKDLKKFLEYGVPVDQAKQTLIKKFGGGVTFSSSSERTLISDLEPNSSTVNLLCRVVSINPKEITVRGESRTIYYGLFGDESGTVSFTAWKDLEVEKGDVLEVSNAYTREWQGIVQLNLGDRSSVKKTDESSLPKSAFESKEVKVGDLRSGMGSIEVTAKILDLNEREVTANGESKKVFSGIIGDESGKAQFTSWHDFKLKKDDVVKISGGYVKHWKGIPQLTFDDKASVKKLDKGKISKVAEEMKRMPIFSLVEKRGALDVEVEGTVIEVRNGSGFIMRCPECNRVLIDGKCQIHEIVEGKPDLRIKVFVDDGTGSVSSVLSRDITEKILGKTLDECKKMNEKMLIDMMNDVLFARRIVLSGNALGDDFGTTVIAKDVRVVDVDIKEEAEKLFSELEGSQ